MAKLPFETNYLSINEYQTFHHNSLHTHQLDHLQKLVELTEKIFEIVVASQDTGESVKLHNILDSPVTVYPLPRPDPGPPLKFFRNVHKVTGHSVELHDMIDNPVTVYPQPTTERLLNIFVEFFPKYLQNDQSAKLYDMMSRLENIDAMRQLLKDIRNISCEMSCNLLEGTGNVDKTTSTVLKKLQNYSWNEKTILTVAAFAFNILELSMLVKHHDTDQMMKLLHKVKGHHLLKLDLKTLYNLETAIKRMMDVVYTNMTFLRDGICQEEASSSFDKTMTLLHEEATNKIIWIVLKLSTTLSKREDQIVDSELIRIATEIININTVLEETLDRCKQHAAVKTEPDQDEDVGKPMPKISTWELIRKIKKYIQLQDHGKLENRHVLYLVSNLDISNEEIKVLKGLYKKNLQLYEIVWLPIVYSSEYDKKEYNERFRELKQMTEWICVEEPLKNTEAAEVIGYVEKDWKFMKQTIVVSVNREAEITCFNALPMLWTWGNLAFPFTEKQERYLWSIIDERRYVDPLAKLVLKGKGRHHPLKLDLDTLKKLGTVFNGLMDVVHTNLIFLRDNFSRVEVSSSMDELTAFLHTEATNRIICIVLEISTTLSKREDQIVAGELLRLTRQLIILNTVLDESRTRSKGYSLRSLTGILKLLKSLDT